MAEIKKVKGGFKITHTTREVWGVDDDSVEELKQAAVLHGHSAIYNTANHANADWCKDCQAWFKPLQRGK
jgi:hypothetical protein